MSGEALERLFRLVDRRTQLRRVIDLSRLGTFQGARGIAAMLRGGVLQVHSAQTRTRAVPRVPLSVGVSLASVIGVGALGLTVQLWVGPLEPRQFRIPATVLSAASEASERERIEVLLEVYRWSRGQYPDYLLELQAFNELLQAVSGSAASG